MSFCSQGVVGFPACITGHMTGDRGVCTEEGVCIQGDGICIWRMGGLHPGVLGRPLPPPPQIHWIWSKRGQYVSYWNGFLFYFHAVFGKILPNNRLAPPYVREILDPPLHVIRMRTAVQQSDNHYLTNTCVLNWRKFQFDIFWILVASPYFLFLFHETFQVSVQCIARALKLLNVQLSLL